MYFLKFAVFLIALIIFCPELAAAARKSIKSKKRDSTAEDVGQPDPKGEHIKFIVTFPKLESSKYVRYPNCMGIIYSPDFIVTSQHCAEGYNKEDRVVLAGSGSANGSVQHAIDDYRISDSVNSIAILHLAKPLVEDHVSVQPLPLADKSASLNKDNCFTVNWDPQNETNHIVQRRVILAPDSSPCKENHICVEGLYRCEEENNVYHMSGIPLICDATLYGMLAGPSLHMCSQKTSVLGKGEYVDFRVHRDWLDTIERYDEIRAQDGTSERPPQADQKPKKPSRPVGVREASGESATLAEVVNVFVLLALPFVFY